MRGQDRLKETLKPMVARGLSDDAIVECLAPRLRREARFTLLAIRRARS